MLQIKCYDELIYSSLCLLGPLLVVAHYELAQCAGQQQVVVVVVLVLTIVVVVMAVEVILIVVGQPFCINSGTSSSRTSSLPSKQHSPSHSCLCPCRSFLCLCPLPLSLHPLHLFWIIIYFLDRNQSYISIIILIILVDTYSRGVIAWLKVRTFRFSPGPHILLKRLNFRLSPVKIEKFSIFL